MPASPPRRKPRRPRARRASGLADGFDRLGRRALLAAWWLVAQGVRLGLTACERAGGAGARWYRRRGRAMRVVLPIALALAMLLGWRWFAAAHRAHPVDEVEALARVIRSEVGDSSYPQRVHVAWVTRNLAAQRHQTIVEMVCAPCGPQDAHRPESSRQEATDEDRALAREVLSASCLLDPTGGATQFIDPLLQDQLARAGMPGYAGRSYRVVAHIWRTRYGWEPYYRLGPTLELWGRARHGRHRPRTCPAR